MVEPQGCRVLVVEDDMDNREVMTELLSLVGYDVQSAADGRAALTVLESGWRPELIILDLMMPGMNGWQLLGALKSSERWSGIRTMVVSAVAARLPASAGADAVLTKPVSADSVLELAHRLTTAQEPQLALGA